jgi:hypothetical protein
MLVRMAYHIPVSRNKYDKSISQLSDAIEGAEIQRHEKISLLKEYKGNPEKEIKGITEKIKEKGSELICFWGYILSNHS